MSWTWQGRVRQLCRSNEGEFTVETAKSILRDHVAGVCCHGDFETRGSQVSALRQGDHAHWFIKGPFPCQEKFQLQTFPRKRHQPPDPLTNAPQTT